MSGKHSRCNSKEFYEFDTTDETDRSLELEEEEPDDVYEMALEVLEADEAFRMQSSGSVSPECDVDRMLENADTERFSGDVTLVRIFSIRQDSEIDLRGSKHSKSVPTSHEAFDPVESGEWGVRNSLGGGEGGGGLGVVSSKGVPMSHEAFDPRSAVENGEWGTRNSLGGGELGAESSGGGGVGTTVRASSSEPCVHRTLLLYGAEFASLDSQHSESEVFADPDFTKTPSPVLTDFSIGGEELLCVARFSNVQSKDAKIRTALTSRSPHGNENEAGSDVSLHVTSSDSLYSAPDRCFDDSAVVDPTYSGTSNVNNTSDTLYTNTNGDDERFYDRFPAFGFREPSPEDLFDEALETRSDLASSIGSSSVHPRGPYFDAVCAHLDRRTPEDEFDLALEMTLHRNQPTAPTPDTLLTGLTDADNVRSDLSKVAECDSSIGADIRRLGHCVSPAESLGTSRDVVPDETTSHFGHPAAAANAGQCPLSFTVGEDANTGDRRYAYLEPWSSDCPSSPEPSYLAECSTDDCIGESEGDESFTDYETPSKTDFFHRLLSRKEQFDAAGDLWNKESRFDGKEEEEESLDNIRICSIEDLLTDDSENERYFGEVVAPSLDQRPPAVFPRVRAKGPGFVGDGPRRIPAAGEGDEEAPNTVALSPPIALAVRADIQFARKSKIPKLPESRGDLSPVRISW